YRRGTRRDDAPAVDDPPAAASPTRGEADGVPRTRGPPHRIRRAVPLPAGERLSLASEHGHADASASGGTRRTGPPLDPGRRVGEPPPAAAVDPVADRDARGSRRGVPGC